MTDSERADNRVSLGFVSGRAENNDQTPVRLLTSTGNRGRPFRWGRHFGPQQDTSVRVEMPYMIQGRSRAQGHVQDDPRI